jgi:hypothetical protein
MSFDKKIDVILSLLTDDIKVTKASKRVFNKLWNSIKEDEQYEVFTALRCFFIISADVHGQENMVKMLNVILQDIEGLKKLNSTLN